MGESAPPHVSQKLEKTMDKKFYEMPEIEVVELKLQGMLCASGDGIDEGTGEGEIIEEEI